MALSDKKRLAKLKKKQKKRKRNLANKNRQVIHENQRDSFLESPLFVLPTFDNRLEIHTRHVGYLNDVDYEDFNDEDHNVRADSVYKGCPVHKIIGVTTFYLQYLANKLNNQFNFGVDIFHYLAVTVDAWNIARGAFITEDEAIVTRQI